MGKSNRARISHVNVADYQRPMPGLPSPLIFYCHLSNGFYIRGDNKKRRFHPSEIGKMVEAGTLYPLTKEIPFHKGDIVLLGADEKITVRGLKNRAPTVPGKVIDSLP